MCERMQKFQKWNGESCVIFWILNMLYFCIHKFASYCQTEGSYDKNGKGDYDGNIQDR
jgi:hypothetical protein